VLVLHFCEISSQIPDYEDEIDLNSNPYRHREMLDPRGRYQLEWAVDWLNKRIIFNVTAATSGYVGFGLSKKGKMCKLSYSNLLRYN